MSSFNCEHCGAACIDTDKGYVSGCKHYPIDADNVPSEFMELVDDEFGSAI